jgi:hypothetical protein
MKRFSALFALLVALTAAPAFGAVKVVTSLQDFASIADAVGGKRVETFALAKGYQDPHFVEPKPSFVLKLSKADLLIVAGLELEVGYLPPLIDQSRNEKIRPNAAGYLDASTGCDILERPTGTVTRAMGDVHPYGNPHYWLDPDNGRVIARAIAAKLSELDPSGAAEYKSNLAAFEAKLAEGEKRWDAALGPYAGTGARHVPHLLAELPEALQAHGGGLHRAEARSTAVALSHAGADQHDDREEDPGHPHGAVLRPEDAEVRRRQDRRHPDHRSFRRSEECPRRRTTSRSSTTT